MWVYEKLINLYDLLEPSRGLLRDNVFKVHCRVWLEGCLRHEVKAGGSPGTVVPENEVEKLIELTRCLITMRKDELLSNFQISTPITSFKVHEAFLVGTLVSCNNILLKLYFVLIHLFLNNI